MRREVGPLKETEALIALEEFLPETKGLRDQNKAKNPNAVRLVEELKKQTRFVFRSIETLACAKKRFYEKEKLTPELMAQIVERVEGAFALR